MTEIIPSLKSIDLQSLPDSERRVLEVLQALEFPGLQVYFSMPMVIERQYGIICIDSGSGVECVAVNQ